MLYIGKKGTTEHLLMEIASIILVVMFIFIFANTLSTNLLGTREESSDLAGFNTLASAIHSLENTKSVFASQDVPFLLDSNDYLVGFPASSRDKGVDILFMYDISSSVFPLLLPFAKSAGLTTAVAKRTLPFPLTECSSGSSCLCLYRGIDESQFNVKTAFAKPSKCVAFSGEVKFLTLDQYSEYVADVDVDGKVTFSNAPVPNTFPCDESDGLSLSEFNAQASSSLMYGMGLGCTFKNSYFGSIFESLFNPDIPSSNPDSYAFKLKDKFNVFNNLLPEKESDLQSAFDSYLNFKRYVALAEQVKSLRGKLDIVENFNVGNYNVDNPIDGNPIRISDLHPSAKGTVYVERFYKEGVSYVLIMPSSIVSELRNDILRPRLSSPEELQQLFDQNKYLELTKISSDVLNIRFQMMSDLFMSSAVNPLFLWDLKHKSFANIVELKEFFTPVDEILNSPNKKTVIDNFASSLSSDNLNSYFYKGKYAVSSGYNARVELFTSLADNYEAFSSAQKFLIKSELALASADSEPASIATHFMNIVGFIKSPEQKIIRLADAYVIAKEILNPSLVNQWNLYLKALNNQEKLVDIPVPLNDYADFVPLPLRYYDDLRIDELLTSSLISSADKVILVKLIDSQVLNYAKSVPKPIASESFHMLTAFEGRELFKEYVLSLKKVTDEKIPSLPFLLAHIHVLDLDLTLEDDSSQLTLLDLWKKVYDNDGFIDIVDSKGFSERVVAKIFARDKIELICLPKNSYYAAVSDKCATFVKDKIIPPFTAPVPVTVAVPSSPSDSSTVGGGS